MCMQRYNHNKMINHQKKKNSGAVQCVRNDICLSKIPHIDMVWSFAFDYMHGILAGVDQQIFKKWTSDTKSPCKMTKEEQLQIENRLKLIRPTQNVHRLPQPLKNRGKWK